MKQDNYLIRYYKNNNEMRERVYLKKKMFYKTLILLICSILFYAMINFSSINKFQGEVEVISSLHAFRIIMLISFIIGILGVVFLIIYKCFPNTDLFSNISFYKKRLIYTIVDWFSIIPICIVLAIFMFSYIFIITPVSGDSMMPNIKDGEHVLVRYNEKLERGKVVIVEVNEKDSIYSGETSYFIKRIIGMPGDSVKWENNKLYIYNESEGLKGIYEEKYFEEGYFGNSYTNPFNGTFEYKDEFGIIKTTTVIPEGYYFVMGDNRPISNDSRDIGLIKEENIIGVATHHMNVFIPNGEIQ